MTWQHISLEVNVKGFKTCCISSAVDGTYDMLWNGSEVGGNVNSVCVCVCVCVDDAGLNN